MGCSKDTYPYALNTEASLFGIGANISKNNNGVRYCVLKQNAQQKSTKLLCPHWLYNFKDADGSLETLIEKWGSLISKPNRKREKIHNADCLSRVPQTEQEVKYWDQVKQLNTNDQKFWSIGLGKCGATSWTSQKGSRTYYSAKLYWDRETSPKGNMAGASRALWKLVNDFAN